jgi:hypothetical protein
MPEILIAPVHKVKAPDCEPPRISWEAKQARPDTVRFDLCFGGVGSTMGWSLGRMLREGMGER